jgi:membrane protease YdiL (CAAX protease family)
MSNPSISTLSLQILFPYIAVALTVLITGLHRSVLKTHWGDTRGMWLYFSLFFLLLLVIPVVVVLIVESRPLWILAGLGVRFGNTRIGLLFLLVGSPVAVLVGYVASTRPEVRDWYPYSKDVCTRVKGLVFYEVGYILLYYATWEFLYRGLLFFPLLNSIGFLPAMAISTILSTFHHIGFPKSEIVAALAGGVLFCAIAFYTQSVFYPFVLHALVGVSLDTFICLGKSRRDRSG